MMYKYEFVTNIKYYKLIKKSKKLHYDLSMIIAK
jgi:hypothetical protein